MKYGIVLVLCSLVVSICSDRETSSSNKSKQRKRDAYSGIEGDYNDNIQKHTLTNNNLDLSAYDGPNLVNHISQIIDDIYNNPDLFKEINMHKEVKIPHDNKVAYQSNTHTTPGYPLTFSKEIYYKPHFVTPIYPDKSAEISSGHKYYIPSSTHGSAENYSSDKGHQSSNQQSVPVEKHIQIEKPVPYPVSIPQPYPVSVKEPYPVSIPQPYPVSVKEPYPVSIPQPYPVPVKAPYPVSIPQPYPVPVKTPYPISIPQPYPVPIEKPVPYPVHYPLPLEHYNTEGSFKDNSEAFHYNNFHHTFPNYQQHEIGQIYQNIEPSHGFLEIPNMEQGSNHSENNINGKYSCNCTIGSGQQKKNTTTIPPPTTTTTSKPVNPKANLLRFLIRNLSSS